MTEWNVTETVGCKSSVGFQSYSTAWQALLMWSADWHLQASQVQQKSLRFYSQKTNFRWSFIIRQGYGLVRKHWRITSRNALTLTELYDIDIDDQRRSESV